jgi:hypothetical protein
MSGGGLRIPLGAVEFESCWSAVTALIDPDRRLPDWPFTTKGRHVAVAQYDHLGGRGFVPVLQALASVYGDQEIVLVVTEPTPSYYATNHGFLPGFRVATDALDDGYWGGLSYEPSRDQASAITYLAGAMAVIGSTAKWAIWGQLDWDLVLVQTPDKDGPWLDAGVPFVPPAVALENFTPTERHLKPLTELETSMFLSHFSDESGQGRSQRAPELE